MKKILMFLSSLFNVLIASVRKESFTLCVGKQITNSRQVSILGMHLTNANGELDVNSSGFDYVTRTTSEIRKEVISQKFYTVAPADFMPVDVGEAAWKDEIVQNLTYDIAGDFFGGDVDTMTGNGKISEVGTALSPIRMKTIIWAKAASWNISEVSQAAASSNWDPIEGKMQTLKRNWDLGIQEVAFLGHPVENDVTGLLNNSEVTINTALITKPLSSMTSTEFTAFLTEAIGAFYTNSDSTAKPNTFIIPTADFLGLASPYSAAYPNISKLEYMQKAFEVATENTNFQIKSLAYCQADNNVARGINKNRYVFYINEKETLKMTIPVDFNMHEAGTSNNIFWQQPAMGQYSGVLINRPAEVLYLDY